MLRADPSAASAVRSRAWAIPAGVPGWPVPASGHLLAKAQLARYGGSTPRAIVSRRYIQRQQRGLRRRASARVVDRLLRAVAVELDIAAAEVAGHVNADFERPFGRCDVA